MQPVTDAGKRAGVAFVCVWISGVNATVAVALSPALPMIANEFGRGNDGAFIAQMIQTLPAVATIIGAGLTGYACEWFGRRAVMFITAVAFTLAGAAGLVLSDLNTLVASRIVQGLAAGTLVTASYAVVAEYFEGDARNRVLGFCAGFGSFSAMVVLFAAGALADAFGWRSVFAVYLAEIVSLPFILFCMHGGRAAGTQHQPLSWAPIVALWPMWLLQIAFAIGMYMSVVQVPFVATDKGLISASTISLLVATTSASATIIALLHAQLRRVLDFRGMSALIAASFAVGLYLCSAANGLPTFLFGAVILGVGAGSVEPTILAKIFKQTPEVLHDRAAGAAIAALFAGQFLNPIIAQPLTALGGITFAMIGIASLYLVLAVIFAAAVFRKPAH